MTKKELLKNYELVKLDNITVFIQNRYVNFAYTIADAVVKDEFKNKFRYFGGLQYSKPKESEEYKNVEKWLCELAEHALNHKHIKL